MRQALVLSGLLTVLFVATSAEVSAQKVKNKGNQNKNAIDKATPQDYVLLSKMTQLQGKLSVFDPQTRQLSIRVDIPHMEPNPNFKPTNVKPNGQMQGFANHANQLQQRMNHLQQQMHQAMMQLNNPGNARNPQQYQQHIMQHQQKIQSLMQQMQGLEMQAAQMQMQAGNAAAQAMYQANSNPNNQPYKVVTTAKEFDLELQDKASFRKMFIGLDYDDTGKLKQYSKAELTTLRGSDTSKPGYTAKLDEIMPSQEVVLFLSPPKKAAPKSSTPAPTTTVAKETKGEEVEEKEVKDVKKDESKSPSSSASPAPVPLQYTDRPSVRMLVMTRDPNAVDMTPGKK